MEIEIVRFTKLALELREGINIGLTIVMPMLALLFARIVYRKWKSFSYSGLNRTEKGLIGLTIMFLGETARSATVWAVLHNKGEQGTYLSDIVPLTFSLFAVIIGAMCAIRNFTPQRDANGWPVWGGNRLWIACLAVFLVVCAANWTVL